VESGRSSRTAQNGGSRWTLALSIAAAVAIFRFKSGMIQTLAGCCAAGIALFFAGIVS
jgi:chromate transporter